MSLDAQTWSKVGALFDELVDLPEDQRRGRLEDIEPTVVRRWVERLLQAHDESGDSFVDEVLDDIVRRMVREEADSFQVMPEDVAGLVFGNWRTLDEIGRGGMGVVLRGERADGQFEKEVAIKLLPPGPVGPERRARFLAEIRALARLEHPQIAHLIDGGISDDDFPYLVMEHVEGLPIHDYCARHRLGLRERIRLFLQVTTAVAFSHKQLIVHGDIKPSNVLVTPDGQVKLVDFGVAAMLTEPDSAQSLPAGGHCSPAYAAPERLERRAPPAIPQDLYALGAVLYKLLTDCRIRDAREMTSILLGQSVTQPVTAPAEQAAEHSAAPFPASRLRGDLDAICLRALAEDPEQRYETADALRTDLNNWLSNRPVDAVGGGGMYRARKWLRRNWLPAAAVGLVIAALVTGGMISLWQADMAAEAAAEAQRQTQRALAARENAQRAQARAVATRDFLVDLFQATIPDVPPDEMPDTESLLAEGARRAREAEGLAPALRADMLSAIGSIYRVRGRHEDARTLLEQARNLASEARRTAPEIYARTIIAWTGVLVHDDKTSEAIALLEDLIEFLEANAPDSAILLEARYELGWMLALIREDQKALDIMEAVDREVRERDDVTDRFRRRLKTVLAINLYTVGRYDDAQPLYEEAIEIEEKLRGPNHREVAVKLANAAINDTMLGRFERANARYRRALRMHHDIGGEPNQTHAAAHSSFGSALAWQGRFEEALEQHRKGVRVSSEYRGLESPEDYLLREYRIASVLVDAGRWQEAEPYLETALSRISEVEGYIFLQVLTLRALAQARCIAADPDRGYDYLKRLQRERPERELNPWVEASILEAEAHCHRAAGDPEAALEALDEAAALASAMAPGAAADRARRTLLSARILAESGHADMVGAALDSARRELVEAGLEEHPLANEIRNYRDQLQQPIAGQP